MQILLTPEESEQHFHDALCNAVGTGYMDGYGLELKWDDKAYSEARAKLNNPCLEDIWMQILKDGGTLTFIDYEGEGEMTRSITLKDVHERVQKTPLEHLVDAVNENGDATTADVILQTVFFEDVIFG